MLASLIVTVAMLQAPLGTTSSVPNPLALSQEMREFLDKNVDRKLPPMDRLRALDEVVFRNNALNFKYADQSRTAAETFSHRDGNCLSFTLLFIAMARYLDLDVKFREVDIAPTFSMVGKFSTLHQHINAAVLFPTGMYVMDVFPGVNRIEMGGRIVSDQRGFAHFYNNIAVDELGKGNLPATESYLKTALEIDPTAPSVWVNTGVVKMQAGDFQEAEKCYRNALQTDSHDMAAIGNLVIVLRKEGRQNEADRYARKAKALWDKNPYRFFLQGMKAYEEGKYQDSLENYKRALKLKDKEHNFYFAMARTYVRLNQPEAAMKSLQQAVRYAPDSSDRDRYNQKLQLLLKAHAGAGE